MRASQSSFDSSGKTLAECHHRNIRLRPRRPTTGRLAAIVRKPFINIPKIPQTRSERSMSRAMSPLGQRTQHMTRSAKRHSTLPVAANDRSGPAASPRIKLYKRGIAILHADPQAGERLLAEALGAADRDALHGLLSQLVKASVIGRKPDEANLGGFKRSSQHQEFGGCDERCKAQIGAVRTSPIA
ncbi:hypothetical protein ABIB90_005817, partial [Bradyrhizobium sp. JR4.1]